MTSEAERFLAKAAKCLDEARTMLEVGLCDAAGRAAYLAAFHAAQALIFERSAKICRTHGGVHAEFQHITKDGQDIDPKLRAFLSQAYNLKAIADYETGPDASVPIERATDAVATATLFVAHLSGLLGKRTT